ncbi:hypothetical protein QQF64_032447 [Cirrhinus molitorella]|uniref:Uncharacterized protein n=1 Tax=Cirrhinus molitorella TaxID=172907 RepID=A0ABR3MZU1_9TELE
MECRLAPGCLLGSTPPTLLMQSANTSQPSPGKEQKRKRGRQKRDGTPASEHLLPPQLFLQTITIDTIGKSHLFPHTANDRGRTSHLHTAGAIR